MKRADHGGMTPSPHGPVSLAIVNDSDTFTATWQNQRVQAPALNLAGWMQHHRAPSWKPVPRDAASARHPAIAHLLDAHTRSMLTELSLGPLWWRAMLLWATARTIHAPFAGSGRWWLAAAGPSLTSHLSRIRQLPKRKLLVVDTALSTVLAHGFNPDAVISLDAQIANLRDFVGCGRVAHLVADVSSHPGTARLADAVTLMVQANGSPAYWGWAEQLFEVGSPLPTGGNVTTSAASLLANSGAQDLGLLGADFASRPWQSHAADAIHERDRRFGSSRLKPWSQRAALVAASQPQVLQGGWLTSPGLITQAHWLQQAQTTWPTRLRQIGPAGLTLNFASSPTSQAMDPFIPTRPRHAGELKSRLKAALEEAQDRSLEDLAADSRFKLMAQRARTVNTEYPAYASDDTDVRNTIIRALTSACRRLES